MIENITHSLCTLEFEDHRPLYDWYLDELKTPCHPRQIEFARLNLTYALMSKRYLLALVQDKIVDGWDDPRMITVSGLRRRGYTPKAIRDFSEAVGVAKENSVIDYSYLEHFVREDLNKISKRAMAILDPVKVIITNYPDDSVEYLEASNNPMDESFGNRKISFSKEIYIERADFEENPPKKYFRLKPNSKVRLMHAYIIECTGFKKDENGNILEIYATYDPLTKGGTAREGEKIKGTIHYVCSKTAINAEIRLYDHLFSKENPNSLEKDQTIKDILNPNSLTIIKDAKLELSLKEANLEDRFQFVRNAYFCLDSKYSNKDNLVFNRIISLKDSYKK
jgi:glutaminyl-tRNA synthetase